MTADLFRRDINLGRIYPPYLERLMIAKARARAKGSDYLTTDGFRSVERSDVLYAAYKAGGPRAAPGGKSSHNFGLATDEALIIIAKPRTVRWGPSDFDVLAGEMLNLGLHWGAGYSDKPHFSWPGFVSARELAPLLKIWQAYPDLVTLDRLKRVWEYVDLNSQPMPEITP